MSEEEAAGIGKRESPRRRGRTDCVAPSARGDLTPVVPEQMIRPLGHGAVGGTVKPNLYWVVAATLCALPAYAADQPLTGDEIKTAFVGKSFDSSGGILTYKSDGSYEYYSKSNGQNYRGKYAISDG